MDMSAQILDMAGGQLNVTDQPWRKVRYEGINTNIVGWSSDNYLTSLDSVCRINCGISKWMNYWSGFHTGFYYYPQRLTDCSNGICGFPTPQAPYKAFFTPDTSTALRSMYEQFRIDYPNITTFSVVGSFQTFDSLNITWIARWGTTTGSNAVRVTQTLASSVDLPGTSRLHWGTEFWLNSVNETYFTYGDGLTILNWMNANARRFGFVQPFNAGRDLGYPYRPWHWSYFPESSVLLVEWIKLGPGASGFVGSNAVNSPLYMRNINPAAAADVCDLCALRSNSSFGAIGSQLYCRCCQQNCFSLLYSKCIPEGFGTSVCLNYTLTDISFSMNETQDTSAGEDSIMSQTSESKSFTTIFIGVGIGLGVLILAILVIILAVTLSRRRKIPGSQMQNIELQPPPQTPYHNIYKDTNEFPLPKSKHSTPKSSVIINDSWLIPFSDLYLEEEIGLGAYGVVYKATWRKQDVAVKKLWSEHMEKGFMDEFLKELELMRHLRPHKNILQLLGVCDEPLCIVTPFMAGGSLHSLLESDKHIDLKVILLITKDICAGMAHLHAENIIHRDLAARNVLLGKNYEAIVADFGMSRMTDETEVHQTKSEVGPIKWMAIEAITTRTFSKKTDVFSFGVTLWECLTRKEPWEGMDPVQVAFAIRDGKRLQAPSNSPVEITRLMQSCFSTNPEERPTFDELFEKFATLERKY